MDAGSSRWGSMYGSLLKAYMRSSVGVIQVCNERYQFLILLDLLAFVYRNSFIWYVSPLFCRHFYSFYWGLCRTYCPWITSCYCWYFILDGFFVKYISSLNVLITSSVSAVGTHYTVWRYGVYGDTPGDVEGPVDLGVRPMKKFTRSSPRNFPSISYPAAPKTVVSTSNDHPFDVIVEYGLRDHVTGLTSVPSLGGGRADGVGLGQRIRHTVSVSLSDCPDDYSCRGPRIYPMGNYGHFSLNFQQWTSRLNE